MNGSGQGYFNPDRPLTRAELTVIAAKWKQLPDPEANRGFSVTKLHWAAKEIAAAQTGGLMDGSENGLFYPDRNITRAETVKDADRRWRVQLLRPVRTCLPIIGLTKRSRQLRTATALNLSQTANEKLIIKEAD